MKKGKFEQNAVRSLSVKTISLILALVLVIGGVVGGTVAWLTTQTSDVVNTFTYGDINIKLEETPTDDGDEDPNTNEYEMIPGREIVKDPMVTVLGGSEDCWLFVKLVESEGFDAFMTYEVAEGWTALTGVEGVYYCEVKADDADQVFQVIKEDKVTVLETVTKEQLNALTAYPTLTITGYAVQMENIDDVAAAWATITPVTPAP